MSDMPFPIGAVIGNGRYRIEAMLGKGGAGIVYRALHLALNVRVAIKVSGAMHAAAHNIFLQEAQLLFRLNHAHLPRVTDFFIEANRPCLVMEFIDGLDLAQLLARRGAALSEAETLPLIIQVADALAYLHRQQPQIIHRDVKPANIRLRQNDDAVLVDFGIAKIGGADQHTGMLVRLMGTAPYAPTEQYGGEATDAYTDVYALGATMYVLLTGELPPDALERKSGIRMPPPRTIKCEISLQIEQVILKSMSMRVTERYHHAGEMLAALQALSSTPAQSETGPTRRLETLLKCPRCDVRQSVANAIFCQQCGALLVLTFLRANRLLTSVADLPATCDADWESAVEHLRTGQLVRWLEARGEQTLIARLRQGMSQYPEHHAAALESILRPNAPVDLSASQNQLDFGEHPPESQPALSFMLQTGSPGYVHGVVEVTGEWFAATPPVLQAQPGQPIPSINVRVKTAFMAPGEVEREYTGALNITTNRGVLHLPARLLVRNPPRAEVLTPRIQLGRSDARQRIDARASIKNAGGGVVNGTVSGRQPWIMVESQQSRFSLHRGEQHTINFSIDTRQIPVRGIREGALLWETDQGQAVTSLNIEVIPPINVDPHDSTTAIGQPKDLVRLCDYVRGGDPHRWEQGMAWLSNGRLAAALRFFGEEQLARESETLAQLADSNVGLERILRRLGARRADKFKDNQGDVSKKITGSLKRAPTEVPYGILNTSNRGYLHGFVRPLVNWISIPEPRFGCLPGQESVIRLSPDYTRRVLPPLFGSITFLEVVIE